MNLQVYALKDAKGNPTNYVKLRDIAEALNFNVAWRNGIVVETNKPTPAPDPGAF